MPSVKFAYREFTTGINGGKPARYYTADDIRNNKKAYNRRNHLWMAVTVLLERGMTVETACKRIHLTYTNISVSEICDKIAADRRDKKFRFLEEPRMPRNSIQNFVGQSNQKHNAPTMMAAAPTKMGAPPTMMDAAPTMMGAPPTMMAAAPTMMGAPPTMMAAAPTSKVGRKQILDDSSSDDDYNPFANCSSKVVSARKVSAKKSSSKVGRKQILDDSSSDESKAM